MRTDLPKHHIARGITRRSLTCRMQGLEKRDKSRGFRRTQVLSVSRHVPASLNHLADKLVLRKPHGDMVECRAPLSAEITERMTIAALLHLKHESPLPRESSSAV